MLNLDLSFNNLVKNLKKDNSSFKTLRVAILADFASQYLVKSLKAAAFEYKFQLITWEADYDSIEANVFNESSKLYNEPFDYILLFLSPLKLYKQYSYSIDRSNFTNDKLGKIKNIILALQSKSKAKIILSNFNEFDDNVLGNYANKTDKSFIYQIRKLNLGLMDLAIEQKNLFIIDVQALQLLKGRNFSIDSKLYIHADVVYSLDFIALIAQSTLKIIAAIQGSIKKCVILDLDNTLWGGIIGDDGIENIQIGDLGLGKAFTNLQIWLRNLKERGIILCVCSKNTEEIAKEVFIRHPAMVLRLEDISVFAANWETKVDNILFIQSVLNIGFDSIVFLDDNPFEREIIKQHIPDITVPDLPEDPAEYLSYLQSLNLFETASFTEDDSVRTKQYQQEAERAVFQKVFASEDEYLESLKMISDVKPVNNFTLPRVAQLTQRSNQFNLRTVRYTEEDVRKIMDDSAKFTLTINLQDIFGDYGLISSIILEKKSDDHLFIDTWIMSCRVLKRGVEDFVLNEIVELARSNNFRFIEGQYLPTPKNGIVKDHYLKLGFTPLSEEGKWILEVSNYKTKRTFIKKNNAYAIN
jgi:FkbH-like protein